MNVAGLRGGMDPWTTIVNVKVMCAIKELNCRAGTGGGLTQAISDITSERKIFKNGNGESMPGWKGSVINLSLMIEDSEALRRAMEEAFDTGIPIAFGAGDSRESTADTVPCKCTESSVCVASSDIDYKLSKFSNDGGEVKVNTPGNTITSASHKGNGKYAWMSGTNMACPCVAGAIAIYVFSETLNYEVNRVWDRFVKNQPVGIISNSDPNAIVVVTEVYVVPIKTEGPNPDTDENVGFESEDISIDNTSPPPPYTLQCAPTDANGPKLRRGNVESRING
ncbi:peptidase S8/S53 domain-containing protein [Ilyonectria sp. MPI-CAGE-AT-0026]|nr:peptidase S8/S53 domain-containing protein [Ilyonectria sp. MPI-CAGE-AT-0026]KAH6999255.1 peptidase S8/S53 domain-containing protein [Ilyonectria sp. MPI-CAGE-AT-0026]